MHGRNFPCTFAQTDVTMDEEKLIEAVHSFPSLWKVTSKSYKDVKAKENAWKEVAIRVNYYKRQLCIAVHRTVLYRVLRPSDLVHSV